MSGAKIDLDEAREQNAFAKAKIVVEEAQVAPQIVEPAIAEETLDEVVAKPQRENSSSKAVITPEAPVETPKEATKSSSRAIADAIKEVINSARKSESAAVRASTRASSARKTTRLGDDPIKPERLPGYNLKPEDRPKVPEVPAGSGKPKPDGPPVDHERPDADRDEIDMMPKTEGELRHYWLSRMQIIKTRFPDVVIPRKAPEMTWQELRKIYYVELDRVSIGKNVDSYKMIMTVLFFVCEYIGAKFLKIDCTGFFVHSSRSMHRYDRLLIELGEKSYSSFGENWPVEFRLGAMVLVNFVIFCIAKYLFKFTGQDMSDNFFEMFQNLGNVNVESDLGPGAGMDAPAPNKPEGGAEGGLGGLLSGLMGALGGKGGGGLEGILGGLMGGMGGAPKPGTTKVPKEADGEADGNRVKAPTWRRKKPKPKPMETAAGAA